MEGFAQAQGMKPEQSRELSQGEYGKYSYHRITESLGLERILRGHLGQPPYNDQGHLLLDQFAQNPIQPDLQCFQR